MALVALLIATEVTAHTRLLPTGALNISGPLAPLYAMVALFMVGIQPDIFVPYFLQVLHAQSPLIAGYLAALLSMGWTAGAILTAGRSGDARARVIGAGPAVVLTGLAMLAVLVPIETAGNWLVLAPTCIGLVLGRPRHRVGLASRRNQHLPASAGIRAGRGRGGDHHRAAFRLGIECSSGRNGGQSRRAHRSGGRRAGASNAATWLFATFALAPAVCLLMARRVARHSR